MKKFLIPLLAVTALGMAPGAFAHDTHIRAGVGVSVAHRHTVPVHRHEQPRRYQSFNHDRYHRHGFHRHDRGRHHGWHKHRNGRFYRNCH